MLNKQLLTSAITILFKIREEVKGNLELEEALNIVIENLLKLENEVLNETEIGISISDFIAILTFVIELIEFLKIIFG